MPTNADHYRNISDIIRARQGRDQAISKQILERRDRLIKEERERRCKAALEEHLQNLPKKNSMHHKTDN